MDSKRHKVLDRFGKSFCRTPIFKEQPHSSGLGRSHVHLWRLLSLEDCFERHLQIQFWCESHSLKFVQSFFFGGSHNFFVSEKKEWTKINANNAKLPASRFCHTAVVWNGKMLVFGGHSGSVAFNDLWEFDFSLEKWTELKCEKAPSSRCYHTAVVFNQSMFVLYSSPFFFNLSFFFGRFIFGGQTGTTRTNEVCEFNIRQKILPYFFFPVQTF